jgi:hypothetical protein
MVATWQGCAILFLVLAVFILADWVNFLHQKVDEFVVKCLIKNK